MESRATNITYQIISNYGKTTFYNKLEDILDILQNKNARKDIILVTIIKKNNGNTITQYWYYKSVTQIWYPETENKIMELSGEYKEIYENKNIDKHVWILRYLTPEDVQSLSLKLHLFKEINSNQYCVLHESLSIQKIVNHDEFINILSDRITI